MPADPPPDSLVARAATIDELLSADFTTGPGGGLVSERASAWRRASTAGDDELFRKRLARDGLNYDTVHDRLSDPHPKHTPSWAADAAWIVSSIEPPAGDASHTIPFAHVWHTVAAHAAARLHADLDDGVIDRLAQSAHQDLRNLLLSDLCTLCAPALYDLFRADGGHYEAFVTRMTTGGLARLLDDKPVLLRLVATLTRQWLGASAELLLRLDADADDLARTLAVAGHRRVLRLVGGLSDRHLGGRSVLRVEFGDGWRIMYKPRDIGVDARCHVLIERLNAEAPVALRVPRVVPRDGYGWAEFIDHTGCSEPAQCGTYFRRAGAWLALLYALAAGDLHQENLIADGAHPVPVDLETVLQQPERIKSTDHPAHLAARAVVSESVLSVGLLPTYARTPTDGFKVIGGMASNWTRRERVVWRDVNTDGMRPVRVFADESTTPNLPHVAGRYPQLGEHLDALLAGFREYAAFLANRTDVLDGFAGHRVRRVIRPTQFYEMLLTRLRDDRKMRDGAIWSAEADFVARLADWDDAADPLWPMLSAERAALVQLDVPMFTVDTAAGLERAARRIGGLDAAQIEWQCEVIAQAAAVERDAARDAPPSTHRLGSVATRDEVRPAADAAIDTIAAQATRVSDGAAWVGLSWIGDSDVGQLAVLGHDLYSGSCGIAVALAAHAKVTGRAASAELARAAVTHLRAQLRGANAGHVSRLLGIGGAVGLGSVVYGLTVIADLLEEPTLRGDAHRCAALITDDMIDSDKRYDVVGGVAGAALGLLRLFRDDPDELVLERAVRCGEHLLTAGPPELHGMSHGAAGYAYALTSLAVATDREDFAEAAERLRAHAVGETEDAHWRSQWCYGAVGIGLARLGSMRVGVGDAGGVDAALAAAGRVWPGHVDTLCCGALGSIEFFREAARVLDREELRESASQRLAAVLRAKHQSGDYRWNGGATRSNFGLFRGLAGAAYTCLRELDDSLPNVLIWE